MREWFTCCNQQGLRTGGENLLVAVHSCLENTSLQPIVVFDGPESEFTKYLSALGVDIIFHRLSFEEKLRAASETPEFNKAWAAAAFLRFDVPLLTREDVVLYTDTDVLFCKPFGVHDVSGVIAASHEYLTDHDPPIETSAAFNAGVLVMNAKALRVLHGTLVEFTTAEDFARGRQGWYDQGILNVLFRGHRQVLPQEYNWRPFAGSTVEPRLIYFHFLKPWEVEAIRRADEFGSDGKLKRRLYSSAKAQYEFAVNEYMRYLEPDAEAALLLACPDAVLTRRSARE